MRHDDPDLDGPPPPPFVRARQSRRRRWVAALSVTAAVLVIGVSIAVAWPNLTGGEEPDTGEASDAGEAPDLDEEAREDPEGEGAPAEDPEAPGEDTQESPAPELDLELDDEGRPDREVPEEEVLAPLDVDEVSNDQRPIAELLLDIDASERSMLGFQLEVQAAFADGRDPDDPDALDTRVRAAAARSLEELDLLRDRMQSPQDATWAEDVRDTYVIHLDSWVRYLEVVHDDPQILLQDTSRYTLDINVTGAEFSRAVHAETSEEIDAEVVRFAEELIARGFPPPEDSQV